MLIKGLIICKMAVRITNIVKGIWGTLRRKKRQSRFTQLTWLQEKMLKHEEDQSTKTITLGDLHLTYKRPYEVLHTYKELFEDEIYNFKARSNTPFIIDCGANIGLSALYFKKLYSNATVLAYEPDTENFQLLQKNIAQNNLHGVECRQKAVWINNSMLSFASDGSQGSKIAVNDAGRKQVQVQAERLADILKENKVDFLKIDIEGAEVDVLKDCEPFLENVQQLFVEYHGKAEESEKLAQLLQIVKGRYKVYIKMAADHLEHPFVNQTTGNSFDVQLNIFCYR
jgi:FkbM family methyltransferase